MKAYIGETSRGRYILSKNKQPGMKEIEIDSKDIEELTNIPLGDMLGIQAQINYILSKQYEKKD